MIKYSVVLFACVLSLVASEEMRDYVACPLTKFFAKQFGLDFHENYLVVRARNSEYHFRRIEMVPGNHEFERMVNLPCNDAYPYSFYRCLLPAKIEEASSVALTLRLRLPLNDVFVFTSKDIV